MKILSTALLVNAAILFAGCGEVEQTEADAPVEAVAEAVTMLTMDARSADDRARDAGRKPIEVMAAMGIEPGMNVLELGASGGWYTEVLSIALGPDGQLTAQNTKRALEMRDGANEIALSARLADGRLPNVTRLNKETYELSADDGQFDAAFTALNFHDIYNSAGEDATIATMAAVYSTLKPGGFFVVIDHQGSADFDNVKLHRALKADVIRVLEAAGFELDKDSDVLQHHEDDMSKHVFDDSVRGKTNRFLLKLRKPG